MLRGIDPQMDVSINSDQLMAELRTLASFSSEPAPVVTRVVFTEADLRGRAYLRGLCEEAGLGVRADAAGNTFFRWVGRDENLPAVGTGSHIDAIPNAGMYDGTVGVLGGLEAIRALQRSGFNPARSIELLLFTSEEPTRFGIGCIGSRLLAGTIAVEDARRLKDGNGSEFDEVRRAAGFEGELEEVLLVPGYYSHFVELHIEQGRLLERERTSIGIVTGIAAPASFFLTITGEGGHAGALLMPDRHDALAAASEIILEVESAAKSTGAVDTVATVGICDVFPGAVNSVPSRVRLSLDVRDIDEARRDDVLSAIHNACEQTGARRGVRVEMELINADAPAICDARILDAIGNACAASGISSKRLVSRAYHDSLFISRIAPTAMIFIPCRGGVSHRPDEYASPEDISRGALVLARTLAQLAC